MLTEYTSLLCSKRNTRRKFNMLVATYFYQNILMVTYLNKKYYYTKARTRNERLGTKNFSVAEKT